MPSFDVVSEVDKQEVDNAINQARKELITRFDFKGSDSSIELTDPGLIELSAENAGKLKSLIEIVIGKLAKRNIDLRNIERKEPAISPLGHARQEIHIKEGLDGDKSKEIIKAIKGLGINVQCQIQDRQIRVTGKKKGRSPGRNPGPPRQGLRPRAQFQEFQRLTARAETSHTECRNSRFKTLTAQTLARRVW